MQGSPERRFRREIELIAEQGSVTAPKPRRSAGRIVKLYWLQSLGFVGFLVAVFLFAAKGYIGN